MWTFVYCFLAAVNGYYAVVNWPNPMSIVSAALCLWMVMSAVKSVRSS